jgi:hypothetical protein
METLMSHCSSRPSSLAHLYISFLMGRQTVHVHMCSTRPFITSPPKFAQGSNVLPVYILPAANYRCTVLTLCVCVYMSHKMFYDRKERLLLGPGGDIFNYHQDFLFFRASSSSFLILSSRRRSYFIFFLSLGIRSCATHVQLAGPV